MAFALAVAPGCSSFDEDVFPHVVRASLRADPENPDALAAIDVRLRLVAGPDARREVALGHVELWRMTDPPARAATLDLAFPGEATRALSEDEEMTVDLANLGTTNAELAALCGETFYMPVMLRYPEDPSGFNGTGTGSGTPRVTVTCD